MSDPRSSRSAGDGLSIRLGSNPRLLPLLIAVGAASDPIGSISRILFPARPKHESASGVSRLAGPQHGSAGPAIFGIAKLALQM
jgi:hypothetical protein